MNGRIGTDRNVGEFTCYSPCGYSVVDYFVVSAHLMSYISDMSVSDHSQYSDHCPIILSLKSQITSINPPKPIPKCDATNDGVSPDRLHLKWNGSLETLISELINSPQFLHSLSEVCAQSKVCSSDELICNLNSLLISVLKPFGNKKQTRTSSRARKSPFPKNIWFDSECKLLKKKVNRTAKEYRKNPNCPKRRVKYWAEREIYN